MTTIAKSQSNGACQRHIRSGVPILFISHILWIISSSAAEPPAATANSAKLWRGANGIENRDLLLGSGGKKDMPSAGAFEFLKEELSGTNPKMVVRDSRGVKWIVKLGAEAKPETVATRLVWAAGYYVDEDYFLARAQLTNVPKTSSSRLGALISRDSEIRNARFERERKGHKERWSWKDNEFRGTREWNGLRVLMAALNNWDLKDDNNSIYASNENGGKEIYAVSDLGASFGPTHFVIGLYKSRGNLPAYEHSKFITRKTPERVSFATPGAPSILEIFVLRLYVQRMRMRWIGRDIPRSDAKWMGSILARLSHRQVRDAFRAGGYQPDEIERFARVFERRIAELNAL